MSELFHPTPSLAYLQFSHWLKRKGQILSEPQTGCRACGSRTTGMWQGHLHPRPILLHKLIDDELWRLRQPAWLDFETQGYRR